MGNRTGAHLAAAALVALLCTLGPSAAPAAAAQTSSPGASGVAAPLVDPVQAVILIHHPADHVDPFGVAAGPEQGQVTPDTFSSRYGALRPPSGAFPFPTFVADGVAPVLGLPDESIPFQATVQAYEDRVAARLAVEPAAALTLDASAGLGHVTLTVEPAAGASGQVEAWVAVVEDPIQRSLPPAISNGVTVHRFTVRSLTDLGAINLESHASLNVTLSADPAWDVSHLSVAAWLQAPAGGRFDAGEAVQAVSARVGGPAVRQSARAVLVEAYSATWCTPCLYGDLALEQVGIRHAGAAPTEKPASHGYFVAPDQPVLVGVAALVAGVAVASSPWTFRARRAPQPPRRPAEAAKEAGEETPATPQDEEDEA